MSDPITIKCRSCKTSTQHEIIACFKENGTDEKHQVDWWNEYQVVRCLGCQTISFRREHQNTDCIDETNGLMEIIEELYPDPTEPRQEATHSSSFPPDTYRIYRETLTAFNHNLPVLTAIGLRATVESICLNLKTGTRTLKDGIDTLANLGHLTASQADYLHKHRFLGNEAAHQMRPPTQEQLGYALDIAETLLTTIYVLPHMAKKLDS